MALSSIKSELTTPTGTSRRASAPEVPLGRDDPPREQRSPASARRRASQGREASDRPAAGTPHDHRAFTSLTSIRFRRGESEWVDDGSSVSGESYAGSRSLVEEVLNDVCGDAPPAERRDVEEGSHRSLSNGSDDDSHVFDLGRTIFRLAGGGGGRRPEHWTAADGDGVADGPANLDLLKLVGGSNQGDGDGRGSAVASPVSQRQGIFLSYSARSSARSSAGSSAGSSARSSAGSSAGCSTGSSVLWNRMEDCSSRHSKITEVSPLTAQRRRKRRRRRLVVRRCAKAVVGLAALAALGGSVGYFVLGQGYDSVVKFSFVYTVVGLWRGAGSESLTDSDEGPAVHRTLPARLGDMFQRHMWGGREHAVHRNAMVLDDQGGYYNDGQGQDRPLTEGGRNGAPRWDYRPTAGHPLGTEDGGTQEEMRDHVPQGRSRVRQDFAEDADPRHGVPSQGAGWN